MRKISYCQSFPWKNLLDYLPRLTLRSIQEGEEGMVSSHAGSRKRALLLLSANCVLLNLCWMDLCALNENSSTVSAWRLWWSPPQKQNGPPTPNFVHMSRLMMPHMHQEGMKRFMTHIMRLSGESRASSQDGLEWFESAVRGRWLGIYGGYGVGLEWRFLGSAWPCVIGTPWNQGREHPAFLISLSR